MVTDGSEAAAGRALRPPRPLMASGGRHAAVSVPRTKATAGPLPLGPTKDTRRRAGACGRWAAIDAVPWPLVVILGAQVVVARHVLRHLGRHRRLLLLSRESFTTLFGTTISAIRRFTSDPVLITETGISPTAGKAARIPELFAGARAAGVLGLVYFDAKGYRDWRLDQDADALAAFRKAAQGFG